MMKNQHEAPATESSLSTAPRNRSSLAATSSERVAQAFERRRVLLALATMTGAVVVDGCGRKGHADPRHNLNGVGLPPPAPPNNAPPNPSGQGLTAAPESTEDKLGPRLPLRRLGNTGIEVTLLGVGGVHVGDAEERDAQEIIETAIAEGIRFFDTANMYSEGMSEKRFGRYLVPKYRDHVFLMSKSHATNANDAAKHLEASLRRCGCDFLDLWQIHALQNPTDADSRVEAGVLDTCEQAVKEGKVKYLGFTGHANYKAHLRMLEHVKERSLPVAAAQMPLNLVDPHYQSFSTNVVKPCIEQGIGILAMKTLAFGRLFGRNLGWAARM